MDFIVFPDEKANPRKGLANQLPNEQIRVLDVCCGTGNSAIAIGKKNINNTVIGIDLSSDAYFGHIRTLIPGTSGQHNGIIRTE